MASSSVHTQLFAARLTLRAAIVGALLFAAAWLTLRTTLYATAALLLIGAAVAFIDLVRAASRTERVLADFLDSAAYNSMEAFARSGASRGHGQVGAALERASKQIFQSRSRLHADLALLQSLVDCVGAALIVLEPDGRAELRNRAARALARRDIVTLADIEALGAEGSRELNAIAAGERKIVRLEDGSRVLASMLRFSVAGQPHRLLSLQRVEGELDGVELKAWRDLVRVLSHEMMNSLTPIAALAECLEELAGAQPVSTRDIAEAAETIARRARSLAHFIERYRQVAAHPQAELQYCELAGPLERVIQLMRPAMQTHGIALQKVPPCFQLTARVDEALIGQALINLLTNAIEALRTTDSGVITLRCEEERGWIALSVEDNGPGVEERDLESIFTPFFSTKPEGSGIGLTLVRQVANAHGGWLDVRRNSPTGMVFRLRFPASKASGQP